MRQRSDEWFLARLGKVTASRISDVIAKGRSGEASKTRVAYMAELIAETLTGVSAGCFQGNQDTERGVELEPSAIAAYESLTGRFVDAVGFVPHPRISRAGASPDGCIGGEGLLEVKAPRTHTHLSYLLGQEPPSAYVPQMAWQCACTGRAWVDFASYCPAMPDDLRLFVVRYVPSATYIKELESAVTEFLKEMDEKLTRVQTLRAA